MSDENPFAGATPTTIERAMTLVKDMPDQVKNALLASWFVAKEEFLIGGMDAEVERFINRASELGTNKVKEMMGQ